MIISQETLNKYGALKINLEKDDIVFHEDAKAFYYYQIYTGLIKMYSLTDDGGEVVQGFFGQGESFGEPPLFADFSYPASAVALVDSVIWKLDKNHFINLLRDNFEIHLKFNAMLCNRLQYKSMLLKEITSQPPEHRILSLIDYFKTKNRQIEEKAEPAYQFRFPFTRSELAGMIGLRTETVIRYVRDLEKKGKIKIINRKIYR